MLLRTARSTSLLPEMVGTVLLERGGEKRDLVLHPCHPTDPKSPTPSHKVTVAQRDTRCVGLSGPLHWTFFHWRSVGEPQDSGSTGSTFEWTAHPVLRAGRRHQQRGRAHREVSRTAGPLAPIPRLPLYRQPSIYSKHLQSAWSRPSTAVLGDGEEQPSDNVMVVF